MSLPSPISATDNIISSIYTTLATVLYIPVPCPGRIKLFQVAIGAALGTADETWTLAYAPPASTTFTNVTGAAPLVATASSAAGNVTTAAVAPSTSAYVQDGGCLRITPSGGGSGAVPVAFQIVIGG